MPMIWHYLQKVWIPQLPKPNKIPVNFDFKGILPDWQLGSGSKSLMRQFIFADFNQAFQFMTLCAAFAQEIDHHPDWSNSWNKVSVTLTTHSEHGLTELDISMACAMDQFAKQIL